MKRTISERDNHLYHHHHHQFENNLTMANCLMFLSRSTTVSGTGELQSPAPARVFECKTCNRQFPSFQALGGHRASHKKPRLSSGDNNSGGSENSGGSPAKPKTHECTVCGLEFAIGQALGGHMRRHRTAMASEYNNNNKINNNISNNSMWMISDNRHLQAPVIKKISGNSGRRVNLCLDLNLTPLENDIKILQLGKPLVNIF